MRLRSEDEMSIQKKRLIELLQARYREDPKGFREYLPGAVDLLPEQPPDSGRRRSLFGLTEQEIAFHRAGLAEVFEKLDESSVATQEAARGLQHCAALIVDDNLPEEVDFEKTEASNQCGSRQVPWMLQVEDDRKDR